MFSPCAVGDGGFRHVHPMEERGVGPVQKAVVVVGRSTGRKSTSSQGRPCGVVEVDTDAAVLIAGHDAAILPWIA